MTECTSSTQPEETSTTSLLLTSSTLGKNREPLRLLVIGSRNGVINTIHTLQRLNFAEVGAWSRLLPGRNPGEVMSILTLRIPAG